MSENTLKTPENLENPALRVLSFAELGLLPELLKAIADSGYTVPTPIQREAIPLLIQGRDLMGGAQTGTGKTAAFTLPILQRILPFANSSPSPARHPVRALILAPTRELAMQVDESVKTYARHTALRNLCVFGGVDIKPQIAELKKGVEILVATPGRLLDLVESKSVNLSSVQALVLDEADRMLDMGFIPDVTRILNLLPIQRQSLLFSATFSEEIKKLADKMLQQPVLIEVARRNQVSDTITHRVHPVSEGSKRALLIALLRSGEIRQGLVFVKTKQTCARLSRELQRAGIKADAIHGDKSQIERLKTLEAFKTCEIDVLVGTDVAARGLDVDDLHYVINYELPHVPEDYVHRIGRTGRAGKTGQALSLVSAAEIPCLIEIEKLIKKTIEQVEVEGFPPEDHYAYPPGGDGKRPAKTSSPPSSARADTPKPAAKKIHRIQPYSKKNHSIAPDGFDFSKPYEAKTVPTTLSVPTSDRLLKREKTVAALLGGMGKPIR